MAVNLFKAGAIVFVVTTISKLLGFLRETFVAYHFGTSYESDAYYLALTPSTLAITFSLSLSSVFLPLFIKYLKKKEDAYDFANKVLLLLLLGTLVIYGAIFVFGGNAVNLIAPGLTQDTEQLSLFLLYILFPLTFIVLAIQIYTVMLNSFDSFLIPSISILPNNLVILIYLLFFVDSYGITGLAFVTLAGFMLQLIILIAALSKQSYKIKVSTGIFDMRVRDFGILLLPILLSTAFSQVNAIVDRALASTQSEGSIAALMYSYRLRSLIAGLFITAVITVTFPKLSRIKDKSLELAKLTQTSLLSVLLLIGPLSVFFMLFHNEIIRVLFERGAFTQQATEATGSIFLYYSLGLLFLGYRDILSRNFFAAGDTKTPTKIMILSLVITMILSFVLVETMGIAGLGLSSSIGLILNAVLISYSVRKVTSGIWTTDYLKASLKILVGILISGLLIWFVKDQAGYRPGQTLVTEILYLLVFFIIQFISLFVLLYLLKVEMMSNLMHAIKRKFVKER